MCRRIDYAREAQLNAAVAFWHARSADDTFNSLALVDSLVKLAQLEARVGDVDSAFDLAELAAVLEPRSEDAALTKAHVLLLLNDAAAAENVLSRFYAAVNQRIGGNHGSSEPSGPPDRPPWHLTVPTRPLTFTQVRMEWEDIVCPERVK